MRFLIKITASLCILLIFSVTAKIVPVLPVFSFFFVFWAQMIFMRFTLLSLSFWLQWHSLLPFLLEDTQTRFLQLFLPHLYSPYQTSFGRISTTFQYIITSFL